MLRIVGRESDYEHARRVIDRARRDGVARFLRIVGASGIGKTALLETIIERVPSDWIVARTDALAIQQRLPLFVLRRACRSLESALGERERASDAPHATASDDAPAQRFLRLLDAATSKHPVLIGIDDAQWCDPESAAALEASLAALGGRPLVLVTAERGEAAFSVDDSVIALKPLPAAAAEMLVRDRCPAASASFVETIVAHAGGYPADIVALAASANERDDSDNAGVEASLRATIGRRLDSMAREQRDFLHVCAVIERDVPLSLLSALYPDAPALDALVESAAALQFIVQHGDALRFVHPSVARAVRETIGIDIPYRRRVLAAIRRLVAPNVEEIELAVDQARACGDRAAEVEYLEKLSQAAASRRVFPLAAHAIERLIEMNAIGPESIVATYVHLSGLYTALGRDVDALRAANDGIAAAERAGTHGTNDVAGADRKQTARNTGPTRREREIAELVARGMTNREIATRLVLSERTVESHIANLFAKLNVGSRTQLATWAVVNGLLPELLPPE